MLGASTESHLHTLRKQRDFELVDFGGKPTEQPTVAEIAAAKEAGVWRDTVSLPHDELIERIAFACGAVDRKAAVGAFVAGLGQGRPEWRSTVSSVAIATHLSAHPVSKFGPYAPCSTCGAPLKDGHVVVSPNSCVLARYEAGGWSGLDDVLVDLEDFVTAPAPTAGEGDRAALRALLEALRSVQSDATPSKLSKDLGHSVGRNAAQRQRTIETLAIIGVLEPEGHPSFWQTFPPFAEREGPDGKNDWDYPAIWWRGKHGVNEEAVAYWFGDFI